jgi:hypothetical protein
LNQTSPTALTAEGIFEVSADNKTMKYEVVQTELLWGLLRLQQQVDLVVQQVVHLVPMLSRTLLEDNFRHA